MGKKSNNQKFENKDELHFLIISSVLSGILGFLYIWDSILDQFSPGTYVIIGFAFIYIPVIWIFRRLGFTVFNFIYGVVLVFIIAFYKTSLYNNYTGLLAVFIVMMIKPTLKWYMLGLYLIAVSIAFALNEENLCHYLIHVCRGGWLFHIFNHVLQQKYQRRKLVLYDDEIKILTELSKNRLQKSIELEGFSESTIYRRIKSAMKRNDMSKKQLIEEFKREMTERESH